MRLPVYALLLCLIQAPLLADGFDDLRLRWFGIQTGGGALDTIFPSIQSHLASIKAAASKDSDSMVQSATRTTLWSDLASTTVSAQTTSTYDRLRAMAIAWATPGQSLYHDATLLANILSGMDWMAAKRYTATSKEYDNWWDWEIGSPVDIVNIAILLYDKLTPSQLATYMAAVHHFDSDPSLMMNGTVATGANLADKCKIAILSAVLVKDSARLASSVTKLSPVFGYVTASEGFYIDGAFIQHGHHPYNGDYGLVLFSDVTDLLYLLAGSSWDVTDPNRANVSAWITESFAPLLREGAMLDMVRGRAISRSNSTDHKVGHSTIAVILRATQLASASEATSLRSAIKRWLTDDTTLDYSYNLPLDLIALAHSILTDPTIAPTELPYASRIYASMDRALHLRPSWAAGIAMHSTRIYNYESINNQNLHGWHTGDGMTYLYNSDLNQFAGAFWPTVDPQRLPGTTVIAGSTPNQSRFGSSSAVGGASLNGYSAVMLLLQPHGGELSARKSWFLFDDELVALGSDISSSAGGQTVETIVDNRLLTTNATFTSDSAGAWAYLAGSTTASSIGYIFPDGAGWKSLNKSRTGAWRDINAGDSTTQLTAKYQTLWFDHGVAPTAARYSYLLLPGKTPTETAAYALAPSVQIVRNDATAQAVTHAALGIQAVNFWTAVTTPVAGITSDSIASVIVQQSRGLMAIAVSDPTQANTGIVHIQIATSAAAVVSADPGITVDQTTPALRLSVNVNNSAGKSFRVNVWTATPPAGANTVAVVSAASGATTLAPTSLASAYASNLAWRAVASTTSPLPTELNGTNLSVQDSAGVTRSASLLLVAPGQVNFEVPPGTASGTAQLTINGTPLGALSTSIQITPVSPGLFSANADSKGVAAATVIRVDSQTQSASSIPAFSCSAAGACVPAPIFLDPNSTVYVSLYGTGIRSASQVTCTIKGVSVPVLYFGPQSQYGGLDQVNISLPQSLTGSGESDVILSADGKTANTVTLQIQ